MMTMNEVSLNRPKALVDFVISCFFRLNLFPVASRFSASFRGGFFEFVVSPDNFAEPSATGNTNSPCFMGYQDFFCVEWVVRRVLPLWISKSQRGLVAIISDFVRAWDGDGRRSCCPGGTSCCRSCEREGAARTNRVMTWMTGGWILLCADKDECNS